MTQDTIRFPADRNAYIQSHIKLAAVAMAGAMGVLWLLGETHIWTGAVAGLGAIAFRGWFMASEQLHIVWEIDGDTLVGPMDQRIPLREIETVRSLSSFVQIVTRDDQKHLIKYQADPAATVAAIERARS